jgi:hypothetical protein
MIENIDNKVTRQIRECIEKYHNETIGKELKSFSKDNQERKLGNMIKHNQDDITSHYCAYFLPNRTDKKKLLKKIENKFYQEWLWNLFSAMDKFIKMANKHCDLLITKCTQKN